MSILKFGNVATPATAATCSDPERVPAPGLVPIPTVMVPLKEPSAPKVRSADCVLFVLPLKFHVKVYGRRPCEALTVKLKTVLAS